VKPGKVRPLAIGVFRREDRILVAESYDHVKQQTFYRPLGGRIEFGEYGDETVRRELMEEIGAQAADLRYLGTLQNIFIYNGERGHEIVLVYDGKLVDERLYSCEVVELHRNSQDKLRLSIEGVEEEDGDEGAFKAVWKSLDFFREGGAPLYPDGLLELLDKG
jgi:8-oxo-dGTP pyrophosphatase MutT (NUDIX family)